MHFGYFKYTTLYLKDNMNVLVIHEDIWLKTLYLTKDLIFTKNLEDAAVFVISNISTRSSTMLPKNGDRIYIDHGMSRLVTDKSDNSLKFVPTINSYNYTDSFTITDGSHRLTDINFDHPVYLISDKTNSMSLKYVHDVRKTQIENNSILAPINDAKESYIVNENFNSIYTDDFKFILQPIDIKYLDRDSIPDDRLTQRLEKISSGTDSIIIIMMLVFLILIVFINIFIRL